MWRGGAGEIESPQSVGLEGRADHLGDMWIGLFRLIVPDEMTFTVLLRALTNSEPPQWAAASALLIKAEREYGQPPSTALFNILVYTCARVNDTERGLALLEKMQDMGVPADDGTLAAVSKRKALRAVVKRMLRE